MPVNWIHFHQLLLQSVQNMYNRLEHFPVQETFIMNTIEKLLRLVSSLCLCKELKNSTPAPHHSGLGN